MQVMVTGEERDLVGARGSLVIVTVFQVGQFR